MTTTGARGEALLNVSGEEYAILFTNRALAQAEKQIGKPLLPLLQGLERLDLGLTDTAQLLAIGLEFGRRDQVKGGGGQPRPFTVDDAWRIMDVLGFTTVAAAVLGTIAEVLSYSPSAEAAERPPV